MQGIQLVFNMSLHHISSQEIDLELLRKIGEKATQLVLSQNSVDKIERCRSFLDEKLATTQELFYGINTGFGFLQNVVISNGQIGELQLNLLKSHACGMGDEVPEEIVRWMLFLKIQSLAQGYSGVQLATVQRLIDFYNQGVFPVVYTQGSLGASGDLSPLAHLSLPLIGLGEVKFKGEKYPSKQILERFGWEPLSLKSKEGIALINGTQFMTAYAVHCLLEADDLFIHADLVASMSVDAFDASIQPFHESIHRIRPHEGQVNTARRMRDFLRGSKLSLQVKKEVQDPYSFRCIPQVHGASKDVANFFLKTMLQEINAVTDNPNIFPEEDLILSGGNFHGQPLALSFDLMCMALAEMGNISERRTYQLLSGQRDLPLFLVKNPGLHSGLMIPQYTAAGIVSENKQLCTPCSVDSIVSSNGQEDHVSMGANAAVKCLRVLINVERIIAIELLAAAQALEFRRPLSSSPIVETLFKRFREQVSFNEADRVLHDDMIKATSFLKTYPLQEIV